MNKRIGKQNRVSGLFCQSSLDAGICLAAIDLADFRQPGLRKTTWISPMMRSANPASQVAR